MRTTLDQSRSLATRRRRQWPQSVPKLRQKSQHFKLGNRGRKRNEPNTLASTQESLATAAASQHRSLVTDIIANVVRTTTFARHATYCGTTATARLPTRSTSKGSRPIPRTIILFSTKTLKGLSHLLRAPAPQLRRRSVNRMIHARAALGRSTKNAVAAIPSRYARHSSFKIN